MYHTLLLLLKIIRILCKIDSPPLTSCLRLHNKSFQQLPPLTFRHIVIYFGQIRREEKGSGEVVILSWELILHLRQCERKRILSGDDAHGGEMIDALVIGHSLQCFIDHSSIAPFELPVTRFPEVLSLPREAICAANFLEYGVLGICV